MLIRSRRGPVQAPLSAPLLVTALRTVGPLNGALAQTAAAPPPGIDARTMRAMPTFDVPGLALTIVKDDRVVPREGLRDPEAWRLRTRG